MNNQVVSKLLNAIDALTIKTGQFIAWLTLVMVLISFFIVVLRYGFNIGWIAMQESVLYMHAMVFMLGAAYTLKSDGHVRVDIFYQKMSVRNKAKVNLFGTLFFLLPVSIFILSISFDYVAQSWRILEKSSEPGGLAFVYLNKSLLLLLPFTFILQAIAEILRNIILLLPPTKKESQN